jgi:hypothetical protein
LEGQKKVDEEPELEEESTRRVSVDKNLGVESSRQIGSQKNSRRSVTGRSSRLKDSKRRISAPGQPLKPLDVSNKSNFHNNTDPNQDGNGNTSKYKENLDEYNLNDSSNDDDEDTQPKRKFNYLKRESKKVEFQRLNWKKVSSRVDCWHPREEPQSSKVSHHPGLNPGGGLILEIDNSSQMVGSPIHSPLAPKKNS